VTSHSTLEKITLTAVALTAEGFAPYGDVIEARGTAIPINQGKGWRHLDLARIDVTAEGGHAAVSVVTAAPEALPVPLRLMERHPLGSQVFAPMDGQRYIVVVAPAGEAPAVESLRAFIASGKQGINYHRGTWHHPMIALDRRCDFLEVHRMGPGTNCDEVPIPARVSVRLA
jgi:ureidoglycolate lyase